MEDDDGVVWNAEDEEEIGEVCFWSNKEDISLKDGERVVSQWGFVSSENVYNNINVQLKNI